MPIRKVGSPDHAHFRAIYQQIRQVVESEGLAIIRADEVTEEGSVAKDVISRLANSTLVIADLTDLNPNVFWELGVRHTLRAAGTLLLLDETRTDDPPFDLSYLRILKYRGTVEGLIDLRDQLVQFVRVATTATDQVVRSPVHDWLRHLPPDLSLPASESEAALRSEISDYRDRLQRYVRKYGSVDEPESLEQQQAPAERMRRMRRLAGAGLLPAQMMEAIEVAAKGRDIAAFIDKVSDAVDNRVDFSANEIMRMSNWANGLALEQVTEAILTFGEELHPKDEGIVRSRLAQLAQGRSPEDRASARESIARHLRFDLATARFVADASSQPRIKKADFLLVGFLTGSLQDDDLTDEALAVAEAFAREYPSRAPILRILGRSLEACGDVVKGVATMELALKQEDADDTTSTWLGNTFHNCGRHVDALEMYLVSCWIDLDDSNWFAHCADELALALFDPFQMYDPHSPIVTEALPRQLPPDVTPQNVKAFVTLALSTPAPSSAALRRGSQALTKAEFSVHDSELLAAAQAITRTDRRRTVAELYEKVNSGLTAECPVRARPRLAQVQREARPSGTP